MEVKSCNVLDVIFTISKREQYKYKQIKMKYVNVV
jgi:hypothetical protein